MNAVAAVMAWWVLRPMRKRFIEESSGTVAVQDDEKLMTGSAGTTTASPLPN